MRRHNIFKVVLITLLVFMLLTWILPAASYQGTFNSEGRVQMGLFDLFNYPLVSLQYFGYIALFILVVGGFYGILYKIPAYRNWLDRIVEALRGNEKLFLVVMMVVLAVLTSTCGVQLALFIFFPLIGALILLLGYDKIVVALTLVGSTLVGMIGTTSAYSNVSLLANNLAVELSKNMGTKVCLLVIGLVGLILTTLLYIKKNSVVGSSKVAAKRTSPVKSEVKKTSSSTKKTTTRKTTKTGSKKTGSKKGTKKKSKNSNKALAMSKDVIVVKDVEDREVNYVPSPVEGKHSIWPLVLTFFITVIIFILAYIPWNDAFGVEAFTKATEGVTGFKVFGFNLFGKLLGSVNAFGTWTINDLAFVLGFIVCFLALVYKVKFDDVVDGFLDGIKKALAPAIMAIFVYVGLVIVTYHPFQLTIYKFILGWAKSFNIFTTTLATMLASLFNADPAYAFNALVPYFMGVVTKAGVYGRAWILFQSVYGITMLFVPTSLILVTVLSFLKIGFGRWLKVIWKFVVGLLLIVLLIVAVWNTIFTYVLTGVLFVLLIVLAALKKL